MPSYSLNRSRRIVGTIAITIGDPSGIGPEVVLKAVRSFGGLGPPFLLKRAGLVNFIIVGDISVLSAAAKTLKISLPRGEHIRFVDVGVVQRGHVRFGRPSKLSGRASLAYIDHAIKLIKDGKADCLVTAPVSKEAISGTGVKFSGHTEYIAKAFRANKFAMMLIGGPLRVTLVTRHLPIKAVPKAVTKAKISNCIELSYAALKRYFGISRPRIGVASLNPHGGEGGSIGNEEGRIIKPAVAQARRRFKDIVGPISSEALFYEAFRGRLDCVITMYHDQGLTPLKMLARDKAVNVTLGLPFVRTSPGHGTAFDIAGKGLANPDSMIEAIKMAVNMYNVNMKGNYC